MKKLDRLILRSFLGPLLLTFTISIFVLVMQFLWRYIEDMVGKGLPLGVLMEMLFYAAITFVPMALPIAILFASIMTMGNFGEKYELIAMKAGGVSIRRIMMPLVCVVLLLTGAAFYFANNVLPVAMLKYKMAVFDVTRKKPALNIKPSEYYSEITNYVIRVDEKDPDSGILRNIIIYDHSDRMRHNAVVVADSALMQTSPDEQSLVLTLYHGYNYNEERGGDDFLTRPFTRIRFEKQIMTFDLSNFAFSQTDCDFFKGNYQMMNIRQLQESIARLEELRNRHYYEAQVSFLDRLKCARTAMPALVAQQPAKSDTLAAGQEMNPSRVAQAEPLIAIPDAPKGKGIQAHVPACTYSTIPVYSRVALDTLPQEQRERILKLAREGISAARNELTMYTSLLSSDSEYINRHHIEWQRKYTLSLACFVLFLVGAPFGSIVRKGGLGLPFVASVTFFVLYYMIGMIAEKSIRESAMGPEGMWLSTFIMLPVGIILTLFAASDGTLFARRGHKRRNAARPDK